jgi:hypothetical protein
VRDPARKAILFGAMLAAGVLLIWLGATRHGTVGEEWTSIAPIALGFSLAPFGLVFGMMALLHIRGQAKLLAGEGKLAEWHLTAEQWDKFRGFDTRRQNSDLHRLVNDLWIRKRTPAEGVDVVVGETSLLIDRSYHVLRKGGLPELRAIEWIDNSSAADRPPDCLEFELAYPRGRYGGIQLTTLRVPFPPAARAEALRVHGHFAPRLVSRPGIALRDPRRTYRLCAALFVASLAACAAGWKMAEATEWSTNDTVVPLVLLVAGSVLGVFALVLALITRLIAGPGGR